MLDFSSSSELKLGRSTGVFSWGAILLMVVAALPARAEFLMRQVNLAYLAQRADVIVQGRVTGLRYEGMPGYPHIPTVLVTLQVEHMLRGPEGQQYTFRQWIPLRREMGGKRGYQTGQRLVLFMLSPSQYGLSGPIGREQGRFHIVRDSRGSEQIANEFANAGLFRSVSETAEKAGASLNEKQMQTASTPSGAVPLNDFVDLVEHLKQ
ncbi:MAG: hypothetical protein ACRD3I_08710, partial [Terriglobales bacterium]